MVGRGPVELQGVPLPTRCSHTEAQSSRIRNQFDLEKHTRWEPGILKKYTTFVRERTELELSYAEQLGIF